MVCHVSVAFALHFMPCVCIDEYTKNRWKQLLAFENYNAQSEHTTKTTRTIIETKSDILEYNMYSVASGGGVKRAIEP